MSKPQRTTLAILLGVIVVIAVGILVAVPDTQKDTEVDTTSTSAITPQYVRCVETVAPPIEAFIRDGYATGMTGDNTQINVAITSLGVDSPEYEVARAALRDTGGYIFRVSVETAVTRAFDSIQQHCEQAYAT